ncbi:MAG: DotH/IcmK family type IV secretion protein [Pseudomonadota bacterium]|nr:DotH/IcmK family type IV secretion protein [Pseudomonadota bacterium]
MRLIKICLCGLGLLWLCGQSISADDKAINTAAFNKIADTISPLTQDQIRQLRTLWNESKRAETITSPNPPFPANVSRMVDLSTGGLPTVVRLGAGYVSVVSFFDANGNPWPIRGYDVGNPNMVNIVWNQSPPEEDEKGVGLSHTLMMQAQTMYRTTNMVVLLRGMATPILLEIVPGQQSVDYRLDLQVPRHGPYSGKKTGLPANVKPILMDFANHTPPTGSVQLTVSGGDAQAWLYADRMYLRTRHQVISPAWMAKSSVASGDMHVYEMNYERVVLVLSNGQTSQLTIE